MINVIHTAKPFLYTQMVSWVLLRQHIIALTFFFFVLFGNMEILLLVQKWCNASSNTKNSKKYIIIKALHCHCLKFLLLHLSA